MSESSNLTRSGKGRLPGAKNKITKQAMIYAATLRDQLSQDGFTFADKIQEVWGDIKRLEAQQVPETDKGSPWWTPVDVVQLKLKFLGTVAGYLYPRLGQVEIKDNGGRFTPVVFQVNISAEEKAKKLNIAAERLKRDPAIIAPGEFATLHTDPQRR